MSTKVVIALHRFNIIYIKSQLMMRDQLTQYVSFVPIVHSGQRRYGYYFKDNPNVTCTYTWLVQKVPLHIHFILNGSQEPKTVTHAE